MRKQARAPLVVADADADAAECEGTAGDLACQAAAAAAVEVAETEVAECRRGRPSRCASYGLKGTECERVRSQSRDRDGNKRARGAAHA